MLSKFFYKEYFQDRFVMVLTASALGLSILGAVRVLLSVSQYDFKIIVRYSQYGIDSLKLGDWFTLYELAIFIAVTTVITIAISLRMYKSNRLVAIWTLVLHHIIVLFFVFVSNAILSIPPVTS